MEKHKKHHSARLHSLFTIIIIFLIVYAAAFIASLFKVDTWYQNLKKPEFTPPDYLFSIIWNVLFFIFALAIVLLWKEKHERPHITILFGTNLLLMILWTLFFFGLHRPDFAFFEILLLILSTLGTMLYAYNIRKITTLFLLPYLLWILFAAYLNFQIAFIL